MNIILILRKTEIISLKLICKFEKFLTLILLIKKLRIERINRIKIHMKI